MSKKKRPHQTAFSGAPGTQSLPSALKHVDMLLARGDVEQAVGYLQAFEPTYPTNAEVLGRLAFALAQLGDIAHFALIAERWYAAAPHDADAYSALLSAYLTMEKPILALLHMRSAAPSLRARAELDDLDEIQRELEVAAQEILVEAGLEGEHGLDAAALHERAMIMIEAGEPEKARTYDQQLLAWYPTFLPALNNISISYVLQGDLDQALRWTQEVLRRDEHNLHALCDSVRLSMQRGDIAEAQHFANRAKSVPPQGPDDWAKLARALTFVGDDEGVLDAYSTARRVLKLKEEDADPLALYLTGVAAWRLGKERQAKQLWTSALEGDPELDLAQDALDDVTRPIGEREGPAALSLTDWVGPHVFRAFTDMDIGRVGEEPLSEEDLQRAITHLIENAPAVLALVPILLARGDAMSRAFAFNLAEASGDAAALAAVRDFALGQTGSDAQRMQAVRVATEAGLLPSAPVKMWLSGTWHEVMNFGYEITTEQVETFSDQVTDILERAAEAMQDRTPKGAVKARRYYEQALALEPDSPSIAYNLTLTYRVEGREDEARQRQQAVRERFPDYFFGIIGEAQQATLDGDLAHARALIDPLLQQRKLHISAFRALSTANIQLLLAEGKVEGARSWLDMWSQIDPGAYGQEELGVSILMSDPSQLETLLGSAPPARRKKAGRGKAAKTARTLQRTKGKQPPTEPPTEPPTKANANRQAPDDPTP